MKGKRFYHRHADRSTHVASCSESDPHGHCLV